MQAWRIASTLAAIFAFFAFSVACGSTDGGQDGTADPEIGSGAPGADGADAAGGTEPAASALAAPAFDPLTRCAKLDPKGASSAWARPVVTARVHTTKPSGVTVLVEGKSGYAYGVREGDGGPEIVRRGAGASTFEVLASGKGAASAPGEWMLRLDVSDGGLRGKAWPASTHEPPAWQVAWKGSPPAIARIALAADAGANATTSYVLAGPATPAGISDDALHAFVSCNATMPSVAPPPDGKTDDAGDTKNRAEIAGPMGWALAKTDPRLVVVAAGTSNTIDPSGEIQACADGPRCIRRRFEGTELAYAALRTAGYTDDEIADRSRVRFVMWGYGDTAKDEDLVFHTNGAGNGKPFIIHDLGGENAAIEGPDGAPAANALPFIGTFAYTKQHVEDDAQRMQAAIEAYAKTAPELAAHTLVVGHSWGAAYATEMVLRRTLGFHVDLAMTVAMPKVAADLNVLVGCAETLFISGCPGVTPHLDVERGFHLGPDALPLYRIDRPDDPVANARDLKTVVAMAKDVTGGVFAGHDYVIRQSTQPPPTAQCSRTYQDCLPGNTLCSTKHEDVKYFSKQEPITYVGMYGIDAFELECTIGGGLLPYRCDGVGAVASTYCKSPPGGGERLCVAKPKDCP